MIEIKTQLRTMVGGDIYLPDLYIHLKTAHDLLTAISKRVEAPSDEVWLECCLYAHTLVNSAAEDAGILLEFSRIIDMQDLRVEGTIFRDDVQVMIRKDRVLVTIVTCNPELLPVKEAAIVLSRIIQVSLHPPCPPES